MHKLVLLQEITNLPCALTMLLEAAFTELLHSPFTPRAGWKLEYPPSGRFQYLNICFNPKFSSLESQLPIQYLEKKKKENKHQNNLTISSWYFAASCWIAQAPNRRWPLPLLVSAQSFSAGPHLPGCSTVTKFLWGTEKVKPGRSAYQEKWRHEAPKLQWKTWKTSTLFAKLQDSPRLIWPETKYLHTDFPERKWKHF